MMHADDAVKLLDEIGNGDGEDFMQRISDMVASAETTSTAPKGPLATVNGNQEQALPGERRRTKGRKVAKRTMKSKRKPIRDGACSFAISWW